MMDQAALGVLLIFTLFQHGQPFPDQPRQDWSKVSMDQLYEALQSRPKLGVAKNVILFLGDGMGISNVMASRVYNAQRLGKKFRDAQMSFEKFPYLGLSMTYNADRFVTGSAASAGAYLCGEKVRAGTIGVNQNVIRGRCDLVKGNEMTSILEHSHAAGKWTGLISTARITHASPAASYAASAERLWEGDSYQPPEVRGKCKDIAQQLIDERNYIRVIMGGGRGMMTPNTTTDPEYPNKKGERLDGRNLIKDWLDTKKQQIFSEEKYKYVRNQDEFDAVDPLKVDYLLGLFEPSHMKYEVDRTDSTKNKWPEPSIADMTEKAIKILRRSEKGYFLFVEGARIDHAHHATNAFRALNDTVAFSDAVQRAVDITDEDDTLIIVTADHSHAFTVGGYPAINTNIFGLTTTIVNGTEVQVEKADDKLPYTILSYSNGPSFTYHHTNGSLEFPNAMRRDLTEDARTGKIYEPDYLQDSPIPFVDETHGGEEVAIYARGPMGHLFHKTHEQTLVAHVMMYASCVGPYTDEDKCPKNNDIYNKWPSHVTAGCMSVALCCSMVINTLTVLVTLLLYCSN